MLWAFPANPSILTVPTAYAQSIPEPTVSELQEYASTTAKNAHINEFHLKKVIDCESGWIATSTGDFATTSEGYIPTSFGIAQIHLPAHPKISQDEAFDPYFSINWMINEWKNGNAGEWSCWNYFESHGWN